MKLPSMLGSGAGLVGRRACGWGSGMPSTVRPDPSTLGVVGERGSRRESCLPARPRQEVTARSCYADGLWEVEEVLPLMLARPLACDLAQHADELAAVGRRELLELNRDNLVVICGPAWPWPSGRPTGRYPARCLWRPAHREMTGLRRKRLDLAAGVVEVAEVVTEMHGHPYLPSTAQDDRWSAAGWPASRRGGGVAGAPCWPVD
jgi:hypothetical protein